MRMLSAHIKKQVVISALGLCTLCLFLVAACGPQQFKTPLFQTDDNLGWGPNGLAWNGRDLILGSGNLVIEVSSVQTGAFIDVDFPYNADGYFSLAQNPISFPMPVKICGLAWEGECCGRGALWIADSLNKEILKTNARHQILRRFPSPGDSPIGLAFDGTDVWIADSKTARIYKISSADGSTLNEFISPVKKPLGLAWDCSNIWIIGMDSCKATSSDCYIPRLVKLNVKSGRVTDEIYLPKQIARPSSLVWVNGTMWVGDFALNRIFKLSSSSHEIADDTVYATPITTKQSEYREPKSIPIQELPPKVEETGSLMEDATEAKEAAKEAKAAAEKAAGAAEEAKAAAEKAEKAFELQQKK